MSSQLNVDTIVDKAGSGGTNVKIANTSVTVAEGGSATTNTVQGLAKMWVNIDGENSTMAIFDSFNVSSIADGGSGKMTVNINNDMSSVYYCFNFGVANGGGFNDDPTLNVDSTQGPTASVFEFYCLMGGSLNDARQGCVSINGDLA